MDFIKVVLISLVLLISKNCSAQPEDHTTDQYEVEKCSSDKNVCGTDGKTYSNICLLQKQTGVKLAHEGDCTRGGKKKSAYRPDLILKSKIVNNTEESLQKKLVKHFNPTTGKWEYVVEILPTIVITPTFHHLQMTNDDQEPSSYNVTNINTNADLKTDAAINAPTTELDVNNLPSTYFGKTAGEIFPKNKLIISDSQGPFNRNDNIITEIVGNVTNDSPRSQVDNGVLVPIKNETILPFNTSVSHPNRSHPSVFEPIKNETIIPSFNINVTHPNRLHPSVFPTRETSKIPGQKSLVRRFQTGLNKQKYFSKVFGPIKNVTIPSSNTSVSHPNRSHPSVFEPIKNETIIPSFNRSISHQNRSHPGVLPTREASKIPEKKSLVPQFQTVLNEPKSLDVRSFKGKIPAKEKQLTFNGTNQTNLQEPLSGNRVFRPNVVSTLPVTPMIPSTSNIISELLKPPFKDALLKYNSIDDHSNEVQPRKNQTLPVKLNNTTDFRINGSLDTKNNGIPRTLHGNATETPKINASDVPSRILNYKPMKYYQIPKETNVSHPSHHPSNKPKSLHHHQPNYLNKPLLEVPRLVLHRDFELNNTDHEIKTKNVSSAYPTTTDNVTHTKRNNPQSIINNTTNKIPFKLPGGHVAPFTGVPVFPGPNITIPIRNEPIPHPKEDYDHHDWNVSQSTGEGSVIATSPRDDNHDLVVNSGLPVTNITGLENVLLKNEYNPVQNTSQPIKEASESGDHPSVKLNITRSPNKTEEFLPNNGPHTLRTRPRHSKLPHSAVRFPKLHGWLPPKNIPSIHENKDENIDPTKPNIHTKPESNTKWGTYYIKLPGNVSDNVDLVINWEVLPLNTYQPNLTINVSESIGSKNYTWPKDSKYATDTSTYHKLRSGNLQRINEKTQRTVNKDVWHNTNSRHPQFLVNTRKTGDIPVNVTKTTEIKTYQLEDEVALKESRKSGLLQSRKERKLGAYRYVQPPLQVISKKFGHSLEKYGSYSLDLPSNVDGNFKLKFTWTLRNKLPKTIRSPIDVTEKQMKYDYKWKIGGNNKEEKPIGNEEIQPIRSVNVTTHKAAIPIKHSFGERGLTGRQGPGRRLHDLTQGLGNVHLDIPKSTTKPQLNTTSAPVGTEEIRTAGSKLYPGWYYMKMLFNVPGSGGGGGCSANNNNCTNQNNYNDTGKSQMDPTDLLPFKNYQSLLPIDHTSFLDKYALAHAYAHQGKSDCKNHKTK